MAVRESTFRASDRAEAMAGVGVCDDRPAATAGGKKCPMMRRKKPGIFVCLRRACLSTYDLLPYENT